MSMAAFSAPVPPAEPRGLPRAHRVRLLGEALDALHADVLGRLGREDIAHANRVRRFSGAMEAFGRVAIYASAVPFLFAESLGTPLAIATFTAGVAALAVHKQLQWEVYHSAFHGAYDRLEGGEALSSKAARWDMPIDEDCWRRSHNLAHHGGTNVAGRDRDIELCTMRMTEQTPWLPRHKFQRLILFGLVAPTFGLVLNAHFAGVIDTIVGVRSHSQGSSNEPGVVKAAWKAAFRKYLPYYAKNYLFYPLLAGPFFFKVLVGNALSELCRDVYSALTFVCGHIGEHQKSWPAGTRANGRAEWYAMQIEATKNFNVSLPISLLCGGVDRHIEHHLFPRLPPNRLREIAPQVREICERYGWRYEVDTWGNTLGRVIQHLGRLSRETAAPDAPRERAVDQDA